MRVTRLIYTNSGVGVLALAANAVHKLWKWQRNDRNSTGKATASVLPQLWQAVSGILMTNDISDTNPEDAVACFALSKNDSYVMSASGGKISLFNMMTFKGMREKYGDDVSQHSGDDPDVWVSAQEGRGPGSRVYGSGNSDLNFIMTGISSSQGESFASSADYERSQQRVRELEERQSQMEAQLAERQSEMAEQQSQMQALIDQQAQRETQMNERQAQLEAQMAEIMKQIRNNNSSNVP